MSSIIDAMDNPEPKKRRQPPMKIDLPFDEAMGKIVQAKPIKKKKKK
jgi:hypothetical protein